MSSTPIPSELYAGVLVFLAVLWPVFPVGLWPLPGIVLLILNLALFTFVWRSCSIPGFSYWSGLNTVAASIIARSILLTILMALVVLPSAYLKSIFYSVSGLIDRSKPAAPRWRAFVQSEWDGRLRD
jgi:hypothetical protein